MNDIRNEIVEWLRDAYAMERGLENSLQKQADNRDLNPDLRKKAAAHLQETRRHGDEVRNALQELGADTSTLKTSLGVAAEMAKGWSTKFAEDERIKDVLAAYSTEHFEIACYTALATAAELARLPKIGDLCRRIIGEERRMADWLEASLPTVVRSYLAEQAPVAA